MRPALQLLLLLAPFGPFGVIACSSSEGSPNDSPSQDATGDGGSGDAAASPSSQDGATPLPDATYRYGDVELRADRFATRVVDFAPGDCAGFGLASMPGIVLGPPRGGGDALGSTDVVSLGSGGTIVLSFEPNALVDGPGTDLLVFENVFLIAGDPAKPHAELGEVSVSEDGATWKTFPCTNTTYPYAACAGWHAVHSNPETEISPVDPAAAGGDPFDLADVGLSRARFVRVRDLSHETCPPNPNKSASMGFDLDAIAAVHAERL